MRKNILLISALFAFIFSSKAQNFTGGFGAQFNHTSIFYNKNYFQTLPSFNYVFGAGVAARLSVDFNLGKSVNFAVSTYPYAGLEFITYGPNSESPLIGLEIPIAGELYFGHGSLKDESFFIGAGFAGVHLGAIDNLVKDIGHTFNGVQFTLGSQFFVIGNLMQIRFTYTIAEENENPGSYLSLIRNHRFNLGISKTFGVN